MKSKPFAFLLFAMLTTAIACKKEDSNPYQAWSFNGLSTSAYCSAHGRMVNGKCVANEGYIWVDGSFLLESEVPFLSSAPQTGMDSIITGLSSFISKDSTGFLISRNTYQFGLNMRKYPAFDSLGIGRFASYNAYLYTNMPDGGGDSVKFEFVGDNLKTQTGIIHYYGRMNKTNDTIRGYVSYRLTNIVYPVMWYKLRRQ